MSNNEADLRSVFVIHGRNEPARKGLFDFLRAIGLSPIEWSEAISMTGSASPYIGDVLDAAFRRAPGQFRGKAAGRGNASTQRWVCGKARRH